MNRKWTAKRKNISLPEQQVIALEKYCEITGQMESEVIREALRRFLKSEINL